MQVTEVSDTIQEFQGLRYYLCDRYFQKNGARLHVKVWETSNGPTPDGWHIHHKDEDRSNNQLSNLEALPGPEHLALHMNTPERKAQSREHMAKVAQPAACEWHGSDAGREWHSTHYWENIAPLREVMVDCVCEQCKQPYQLSKLDAGKSIYCSNKCKSAARRASGVDNETRTCPICQKPFTVNRYSKSKTCSQACGVEHRWGPKSSR